MADEASTYPRGFTRETDWKWPMVPARKLVTLNYGRALKADTRSRRKVPVFGTNGQCGWHDTALAKAPGLILGRKGQGPLGVEWCDSDFWVIDTAYYASTLTPDVDLKYFYHVVNYIGLNHLKDGTSNPTLSRDTFGAQLFPLPPLAEQKSIASVLGALDDKIELNRRMNATLESMARALFQSWFVDFDPVRAKLNDRHPVGMDAATAALFPDRFEDSSHGSVPRGWTYRPFGDVADINWGDTNTTKASYVQDGFTAYSASGADGLLPGFDFDRTGVVVSAIGANAGVTWLAYGKWSCIKNTLRFWANASGLSTEFLFYSTDGREKWPQRGSAQPFISEGDARTMQILVPANSLANRFGECVRPWLARLKSNEIQSRTLATLRDTLLPKLLSGELSVRVLLCFISARRAHDFMQQVGVRGSAVGSWRREVSALVW